MSKEPLPPDWTLPRDPEEQTMQDEGLRRAYERAVDKGSIKPDPAITAQLQVPITVEHIDHTGLLVTETRTKSTPVDVINHPPHYNNHPSGVECIQIVEWFGYNLGNAIKYIWRAGEKEGETDIVALEKAEWYIRREIDKRKGRVASADSLAPVNDNETK